MLLQATPLTGGAKVLGRTEATAGQFPFPQARLGRPQAPFPPPPEAGPHVPELWLKRRSGALEKAMAD